MLKVMQMIADKTNGESYRAGKCSCDIEDYDVNGDGAADFKTRGRAETGLPPTADELKAQALREPSLIKFFLDGSRRVFKVDDIAYNKRVFPVVAGQIGVACCRRENKRLTSWKFRRELVLVLPDMSDADGSGGAFFEAILNLLNASEWLKSRGESFAAVLSYSSKRDGVKLENKAIAVVQDRMVELEKRMVAELAGEGALGANSYLLKDGSLQYQATRLNHDDLCRAKNNYNWVIGVSKAFNPANYLDERGCTNEKAIANLPVYGRTPAVRWHSERSGDVDFAVWYVRLRDKSRTRTPFDGVVKVEKLLMDSEREAGVNSDVIDLISANIINERNPTCYGADKRWANNIYPIFLVERFIKSKYLGSEAFMQLF